MAAVSRSMSLVDWGQVVLLSILWGGSFFFIGVAIDDFHYLAIVFSRVALAAAALLVAVRIAGLAMPFRLDWWRPLMVMSILNNVIPWTMITWGQTEIASGLAAIFNATTPLFTVVIANFFTSDEKLTPGKVFGVVLGLCGVAVMIGPDLLEGLGTALLAQLAVIAACVSYACSGVFARRLHDRPPLTLAAGQMVCSTIFMLPALLVFAPPWSQPVPGWPSVVAITCLGLFSTAFAYLLVFRIIRSAGATNFSLVTFLLPITAIILGAAFLHERLAPEAFIGMALIGLGLSAIDGRPAAALARMAGKTG